MVNLDTHILVFALAGDLRPRERALLASEPWGISDIVLWELAKLVELKRLRLDLKDRSVRHALASLHVWPIDLEVAETSTRLDLNGDPADQLIAATSVVHDVPLLTRDRHIRRSKVVPLA
jgi:PIN domain nuclease of toxin-antitoxin system